MQNITSGSALWRKSSLSLFCSVFFAAGSHSANAASYYVNDNNTAGDIYTTAVGSNLNSGTMASPYLSIQSAIDAASSGDTIYVDAGTYNENVSVDKSLTLLGAGSGATIIDGDNNGSGLGTIFLPTGGNNIQIGAMSQGFHIIGIDGPAGLEKAAIYLQGTQSNITIIDNEIEARGDAGLMGEHNASNNNIVIDNNLISGQTFNGANPAGVGSGAQFTLLNVPRQAVVFGGGGGTTNTMNFTFTNNVISTVTGGQSTTDNSGNPISPTDQGNMLVTLDLVGTNTISGNTFNGTTVSWYAALRTRGTGYTIDNNIFNGNYLVGMATGSNAVDASLNYWGDASGPNNPVNNACGAGKYVPNNVTLAPFYTDASLTTTSNGAPSVSNITQNTSFCSIQAAVDAANATDTIVASAGTYDEVLLIDKALTLFGPNDNISAVNGTRVSEAILLQRVNISATTDVTISGFEFFEVPATSTWTIYIYGNSNNFTFENNRFIDNDKDAIRSGISSATGNVTVKGNLIDGLTNTLSSGIFLGGIYGTSLIADNKIDLAYNGTPTGYSGIQTPSADGLTISGNEISNTTNQGLQLAGTCGNVTIENNSISNTNTGNGSDKGAIRLYGTAFTGPITIQNNNLTNSYNGVAVKNGEDLTGQNITITNNNLTGNSNKAIYNGASTGGVNAPCNWYGTTDDAAIQALLVGLVNYTPFLNNGTDNDMAQGFQPVPGACAVNLTGLYVNDNNIAGDIYTTAVGNDANNGSSSAPYLTIQAAVNAASSGDTIYVDAGDYTLAALTMTKSLTIVGSNSGNHAASGSGNIPAGRVTESVVTMTGSLLINTDNITIDGLHIRSAGVRVIRNTGVAADNFILQNCLIENTASSGLEMLHFIGTATRENWIIRNNRFSGVQGGTGAIYFNGSASGLKNILVDGNDFMGSNAAAIFGGASDLTISGNYFAATNLPTINMNDLDNPTIENNTINVNGFGLQLTTINGGVIRSNTFTGISAYDFSGTLYMRGIDVFGTSFSGPNSAGLVIENNIFHDFTAAVINTNDQYRGIHFRQGVEDISVQNNTFTNSHTALGIVSATPAVEGITLTENDLSGAVFGVLNGSSNAVASTCDWWGSTSSATIASKNTGTVTFEPYLTNGTDNSGAIGFQPAPGACTVNLTALYVNDNNTTGDIFTTAVGNDANSGTSLAPYLTIQAAINAADAGDTIYVDAGAYTEQVEITKDVEIIGAGIGVTTILGSANMPLFFTTSGDNYPIVYVHDADSVNIKDLTVDGDGKGNSNYRYQGVGYSNAGGTLDNIEITSVIETPFNGNQHGIGLFADASSGTARTLTLKNSMIRDCQKNAISLSGADLTGYVNDNMITGAGAIGTPLPAQNGIQFYGTAGGEIKNNVVKGFWYTPNNWTATGMLLYANAGSIEVDGNNLDSNDAHIYDFNGDATITNNDIKDGNYGVIVQSSGTNATATVSGNSVMNVVTGIGVYEAGGSTASATINENSITSISDKAIESDAAATLDATCNWYGTTDDASIQALLDGFLTYSPFLNNGTDNDVAQGFQPVPGSCVAPSSQADSLLIVSDASWMMSTEVNTVDAYSYPWRGVTTLPDVSTYTLPAVVGQPYHYHSIDSVDGARVLRGDNGIRFFRTTFNLNVDTGVAAQIISRMDDGMEIYINGHMIAREANRTTANFLGLPHNLVLLQNGDQDNGHNGDMEFDIVNNYRLDSVVVAGENELIIALRNAPQTSDKGGFSFRMELKTGEAYMPELTGYLVSDIEWMESTVTTPGGTSFNWSGVSGLPAANTFTKNVMLGQPYGYYSIEEVPGSFAIKSGTDVTYYTRRFTIMDSADVNVRLRSTFDESVMIYVNGVLIAADYSTNYSDRTLAAHDVDFQAGGTITNGNAGGDLFDQVESVDFDNILRKGDNYVTVALRNKGITDKGGFSLRLDLDKAGSPVIRKTTSERNGNEDKKANDLQVNFNIYPNPTTGRVIIDLIESPTGDNTVTVLDLNGKVIMNRSLVNPQTGIMDIDLSELANGMYIIRVKSGDTNYQSKRVMKF
ncbi:nitrous oxidase accessory protein [Owenweeksia hongkongensis DSM 17368]|uniref:Nitrous oxidase accessory protein n=1 Tax=Owenweeksia hongkongensis (strain DSM 17368 / CIP 108786 / JCM 12287 / NRRL B-23963 / UST20020801) TaxID=926562 RepID=G8R1Q5_OWEHD|nr:right-handed parallel beta-helix repeat-containing protein [Owenweeksia hongkongensis]AEV32831.1 nitrous oxidase accessory protein [Owenweeksia hongkongensis DSM 17368]